MLPGDGSQVMRLRPTQTSGGRLDRSFATMKRLQLENARLSSICARAQGLAARYELLLREGDHRIKNSLQVVASVLAVQARRETTPATRDALQAATARIQVVARIHDALQMKSGDDLIDIGALVSTMSRSLHAMAG